MIFPQNLPSGDYSFIYDDGEKNVIFLLDPTPYSADTPEGEIPDEGEVDNMVDYMLEAMVLKNG